MTVIANAQTRRGPRRLRRPRRGMALAMALGAMVIISMLLAGIMYLTRQDTRMAVNSQRVQQSFGVAESGVAELLRTWNIASYNTMPMYPRDSMLIVRQTTPGGTGTYAGSLLKLNERMYLLDVAGMDKVSGAQTATLAGGGSRQRIGTLLRVVPLAVDMQAALTVGGPVTFGGGNVYIDGYNNPPPGWTGCPPTNPSLAGVRAKNPGDVTASAGQITGTPPVLITPAMDSTTFMKFGPVTYDMLAAQASIQLPAGTYTPQPVVVGGVCTAAPLNWGDGDTPTNPCGTYFPIVHIAGNGTINNGQGQGIMLVDGNLTVSGIFHYYGLIIVRGGFSTTPGGNPKVFGSVLAQSINLATTAFAGDAVVFFSACALSRTMDATGVASYARSRSWTRLY